jgi:hypothetical protein
MAKNIDRVMRIVNAAAALIQIEAAWKLGRAAEALKRLSENSRRHTRTTCPTMPRT